MKKVFWNLDYQNLAVDALQGADACLIMTEWDEFKASGKEFAVMKNRLVIDGRHMLVQRERVEYVGLCG